MLDYRAGDIVPNRDMVSLAGGATLVWSSADAVEYAVDVSGLFGPVL